MVISSIGFAFSDWSLVIGHWTAGPLVIGPFVHLAVDYGQAYDNL